MSEMQINSASAALELVRSFLAIDIEPRMASGHSRGDDG
jgi:hypothetical protein